ncbi:MAG: amino acid permease [Levilactobacillus sp.]|jgi:arginine:ornithine antiporter/lysine permease|uniref:amino acid permease n=1 Tax=Levilactobacillus sp. TaxID=2767919 RepID=UPI0025854160|nr:amino acid permease [Levilactobacillus sp.]MCI1554456.1 amino acid permease [Levilactobacillus sp.]MCI1598213.1 amino acid permease [Levilactobacillus sp.]
MDEKNSGDSHKVESKETVGVIGLIAFVLSAMVGGGIYDLPQNMAFNAGMVGQVLAWVVTGIIMWFIVRSFMTLSEIRPEYTTGLYKYAEDGFGRFTGFFVSWGYWICECFANVTYSVLLMSTLNAFWPGTFTGGNNIPSLIGGTVILWVMSALILRGIKDASWVDITGTVVMLFSTIAFIVTMFAAFKFSNFTTNIFANQAIPSLHDKDMGNLAVQVKNTMMTTLWVFGGVEGAVVLSDKARSQKDVRTATKWGFLLCLLLYALASLLPLGLRSYGQIARMAGPSSASLMEIVIGPIGRLIITFGVVFAVLASWLTWTLMLSEMPRAAAADGTFPKAFAKTNSKNVPWFSVIASTIVMQLIVISTHFAGHAFNTMLTIVGTMTVPPYLISMIYLVRASASEKTFNIHNDPLSVSRKSAHFVGWLAIIGTLFMGYSAGIKYTTISFIIYAIGIPVFMYARKQYAPNDAIFSKNEKIFAAAIVLVALIGIGLLFMK